VCPYSGRYVDGLVRFCLTLRRPPGVASAAISNYLFQLGLWQSGDSAHKSSHKHATTPDDVTACMVDYRALRRSMGETTEGRFTLHYGRPRRRLMNPDCVGTILVTIALFHVTPWLFRSESDGIHTVYSIDIRNCC
jgi:hypothetical protein